ncbi:hypothetical protein FOQG_11984 [Fusarium oxysporum f. sp. raphani 54005]|uniref:Methyltransferase domain-containing protein n=2 Tax=Fusarium oxysporum f. sp. raphani TaxID=96318 RepID=X0BNS1_FUSOX|nr:hypothetical protein FOQG_11984 [Fusarium oxysporum f. sp. raphani 54005]KAG7438631.1 hypothetical protein Forpi1262_v001895 [Fusarium oxysporum f. sp. raphani]KAJ4033556.1 hypothetical protein NW763_014431 [Fusarium oxysporum]WKT38296.1 Methyltransferase domain [Fusarium oxysporum f. sp. vasinfectum]EXK83826.1 hypothetical protein FOQG_11984 [Fusarium oxysporum f. sp. raphani 54005]
MSHRLVTITFIFATLLLCSILFTRSSPHFSTSLSLQNHAAVFSNDPHLNSRLAHAEKLWKRSIKAREEMAQVVGYDAKFPDGYMNPFNVWDFARPSFFCPHDLERVGSISDGGKIICGMSRYEKECPGPSSDSNKARELIVYSFGVSDDSSFEAELLQRTNARIWGYDGTVDKWAQQVPEFIWSRAKFQKAMIGKVSDSKVRPPVFSIQDLMKINGHSYVDLIKMDIEGAEFDALTSLIESVKEQRKNGNATLPFGQLLVEMHLKKAPEGVTVPNDLRSWLKWWYSLEAMGLRPVSNEDNWIGDRVYGMPRFMEYTFINAMDKERNLLLWT